MRLLRALVWPVATYGAEAWTYRKEEWKRWLAFETTGYRRVIVAIATKSTRSSATAEKQRVSCPHGGG